MNRTNESLERDLYAARNDLSIRDQQVNSLLLRIRDYEGSGQKSQAEWSKTTTTLMNELESVTSHLRAREQEN